MNISRRARTFIGGVAVVAIAGGAAAYYLKPESSIATPSQSEAASTTLHIISPTEAQALLAEHASDPSFVLLDVRKADEFAAQHIKGAQNLVDFFDPQMRDKVAALDRTKTYLVYCQTGHRSGEVSEAMRQVGGFAGLYDMSGGITAWKAAGLPVENGL